MTPPLVSEVRIPRRAVHLGLYAVAGSCAVWAAYFCAVEDWRRAFLLTMAYWCLTALGTVAHRRFRQLGRSHVPDWDAVVVTHSAVVDRLPAALRDEFGA